MAKLFYCAHCLRPLVARFSPYVVEWNIALTGGSYGKTTMMLCIDCSIAFKRLVDDFTTGSFDSEPS